MISRDNRRSRPTRARSLARLVDDSRFQEFKPLYGDTLLTGFARITGFTGRHPGQQRRAVHRERDEGAHFIELCCQRDIPLLFMADVSGFMVGRAAEQRRHRQAGAKMITAMASANVPRTRSSSARSYGAAYLAMCGRPFKPTR
jgi:3-methylcrotonyl-CoA carboxylase beta subunit